LSAFLPFMPIAEVNAPTALCAPNSYQAHLAPSRVTTLYWVRPARQQPRTGRALAPGRVTTNEEAPRGEGAAGTEEMVRARYGRGDLTPMALIHGAMTKSYQQGENERRKKSEMKREYSPYNPYKRKAKGKEIKSRFYENLLSPRARVRAYARAKVTQMHIDIWGREEMRNG